MEDTSFFIEFLYEDHPELVEVKPCCGKDNAFYYDISIKNQYQFTITPTTNHDHEMAWRVSLKNADKQVDPKFIKLIGAEIEKHLL